MGGVKCCALGGVHNDVGLVPVGHWFVTTDLVDQTLPPLYLTNFWQTSDRYLTNIWQISDRYLTNIWQHISDNIYTLVLTNIRLLYAYLTYLTLLYLWTGLHTTRPANYFNIYYDLRIWGVRIVAHCVACTMVWVRYPWDIDLLQRI